MRGEPIAFFIIEGDEVAETIYSPAERSAVPEGIEIPVRTLNRSAELLVWVGVPGDDVDYAPHRSPPGR